MNVVRICDFLKPRLVDDGDYVDVRPARKLEADLQDRDGELPLALVHPWKEEAGASRYDNFTSQRMAERFAVITVCPIESLEACRNRLFDAVLGQVLPDYVHVMLASEGETLDLDTSVIWWRDIFLTHRERRQAG